VQLGQILHKALSIRGIYVGSRAMFESMNTTITQHCVEPVIDRVFALDETVDAFRHLESAKHFGKLVIHYN
jgi:NADPH:quinone reductase-like Zn-dependent oxidoreductase